MYYQKSYLFTLSRFVSASVPALAEIIEKIQINDMFITDYFKHRNTVQHSNLRQHSYCPQKAPVKSLQYLYVLYVLCEFDTNSFFLGIFKSTEMQGLIKLLFITILDVDFYKQDTFLLLAYKLI